MGKTDEDKTAGFEPWTLALRDELASGQMSQHGLIHVGGCSAEILQGRDSLWIVTRRAEIGGFALRAIYAPGPPMQIERISERDSVTEVHVTSALGDFDVRLDVPGDSASLFRCTVSLTPADDLRLPFSPRDLYPLDAHGDPTAAHGCVNAAQRGLNAAVVYVSLTTPEFGSALYLQNLTALNGYFSAAGAIPDGCVGGQWPELGYRPPAGEKFMPKGKRLVVSDAFLHWSPQVPKNPRQAARQFLDLLAGIYRHLDLPEVEYHDWPGRAQETLRDIEHSPEATVKAYGNLYLHPYTASEYPDSMVQLTTLLPICEYASWIGRAIPLAADLRKGVSRFFDHDLNVVRRYLPNVGDDKDPDAVDSWYLYHPLNNLARLAKDGDKDARDMLLQSLDYSIRVARHFEYSWPVQFNMKTLDVITGCRKPGEPGQSDTGGLYAYVMLQAYGLTSDARYLGEAKNAIHALADMLFELEYQANVTTWGAIACLRLWKITGEEFYRDQSYVFLACLFLNSLIWESNIAAAKNYPVFLGVTCLHDAPYMALYECFETYAAFHEYLHMAGSELPDSVLLLLSEYCKYTPSRAWYYYPKELPEDILAQEVRNGHIDRNLAFPLEDLYADGQPAGQIGQEIYGCGAAFVFATRSFHRLADAPFLLFCEYPVYDLDQVTDHCISFRVRGAEGFSCRARLIPTGRKPLPQVHVDSDQGGRIRGHRTSEEHWEFTVSTGSRIDMRWE